MNINPSLIHLVSLIKMFSYLLHAYIFSTKHRYDTVKHLVIRIQGKLVLSVNLLCCFCELMPKKKIIFQLISACFIVFSFYTLNKKFTKIVL